MSGVMLVDDLVYLVSTDCADSLVLAAAFVHTVIASEASNLSLGVEPANKQSQILRRKILG